MFTHINDKNNPQMVDVSQKAITHRTAVARGIVEVDPEILKHFKDGDIDSPKGPVFQTAMIAMTMAAKRTHDSICFCHPINVEDVKTNIFIDGHLIFIEASVSIHAKTGIEMEALHAVSVGALNIYDMCKAITSNIIIREVRLIQKLGGKKDYLFPELDKNEIKGLILIGGKSKRMGQPKHNLDMGHGKQLERMHTLLGKYFDEVIVSCNTPQLETDTSLEGKTTLLDMFNDWGPLGGIVTAYQNYDSSFFVTACDLPNVTEKTIEDLLELREKEGYQKNATLYYNEKRQNIEPLFGVFERKMKTVLWDSIMNNEKCPTKLLNNINIATLPLSDSQLDNMNSPEDLKQ